MAIKGWEKDNDGLEDEDYIYHARQLREDVECKIIVQDTSRDDYKYEVEYQVRTQGHIVFQDIVTYFNNLNDAKKRSSEFQRNHPNGIIGENKDINGGWFKKEDSASTKWRSESPEKMEFWTQGVLGQGYYQIKGMSFDSKFNAEFGEYHSNERATEYLKAVIRRNPYSHPRDIIDTIKTLMNPYELHSLKLEGKDFTEDE